MDLQFFCQSDTVNLDNDLVACPFLPVSPTKPLLSAVSQYFIVGGEVKAKMAIIDAWWWQPSRGRCKPKGRGLGLDFSLYFSFWRYYTYISKLCAKDLETSCGTRLI